MKESVTLASEFEFNTHGDSATAMVQFKDGVPVKANFRTVYEGRDKPDVVVVTLPEDFVQVARTMFKIEIDTDGVGKQYGEAIVAKKAEVEKLRVAERKKEYANHSLRDLIIEAREHTSISAEFTRTKKEYAEGTGGLCVVLSLKGETARIFYEEGGRRNRRSGNESVGKFITNDYIFGRRPRKWKKAATVLKKFEEAVKSTNEKKAYAKTKVDEKQARLDAVKDKLESLGYKNVTGKKWNVKTKNGDFEQRDYSQSTELQLHCGKTIKLSHEYNDYASVRISIPVDKLEELFDFYSKNSIG